MREYIEQLSFSRRAASKSLEKSCFDSAGEINKKSTSLSISKSSNDDGLFPIADQTKRAAELVESIHAPSDTGERPALEHLEHLQYPADIEAPAQDPGQVRRGKLRPRLSL